MPRFGRGKDLHQLGNDGARQRAAGNDAGQLPPLRRIAAEAGNDDGGNDKGHGDGNQRSEPHQRGQRRLEIHLVGVAIPGLGDGAVDEVRRRARHQHGDAHDENPDQQLHLDGRVFDAQQNEGDEGDAGDAVGFESVGGGADRVAGVVAGAVGDDAGIARVVFLDLEDDLHQVGADVGDLGEDAAGDAQRGRAQRFTDGKADEAGAGVVGRNKEQDEEHDQQLDADQHHADAHAGLQRNVVDRIGLAGQAGESGARVGEGVDPNAEPRHAVAARDSDQAEEKNDGQRDGNRLIRHRRQHAEIEHDDDGDEEPQDQQEFALGDQVGLAGLVNQLGNLEHGTMHGHLPQAGVNDQAEAQAEDAEQDADHQQAMAVDAEEQYLREIGKFQSWLRRPLRGRVGPGRKSTRN